MPANTAHARLSRLSPSACRKHGERVWTCQHGNPRPVPRLAAKPRRTRLPDVIRTRHRGRARVRPKAHSSANRAAPHRSRRCRGKHAARRRSAGRRIARLRRRKPRGRKVHPVDPLRRARPLEPAPAGDDGLCNGEIDGSQTREPSSLIRSTGHSGAVLAPVPNIKRRSVRAHAIRAGSRAAPCKMPATHGSEWRCCYASIRGRPLAYPLR